MRRPTPILDIYAWHRRALTGIRQPVVEDEPQAGWYRCRMVARGPWCPGRIWLEQPVDERGRLWAPETFQAEILGQRWRDVSVAWVRLAKSPITRDEYERLMREHQTNPVYQATHVPVDLSRGGRRCSI